MRYKFDWDPVKEQKNIRKHRMPNSHHLGTQSRKRRSKSISRKEVMKARYDFSKAERGKFYHPNAVFIFPVYLESDVNEFLSDIAEKKKVGLQDLVNDWLRAEMNLIQRLQLSN